MVKIQTILETLPFFVIIFIELSPRFLTTKFENVYFRFFDSTEYQLVDQSLGDAISEQVGTQITDEEQERLIGQIQNEVGIDDTSLEGILKDYIEYSHDWLRSKTGVFFTFSSFIVVFSIKGLSIQEKLPSVFLLISFISIFLFLSYMVIDEFFERRGPYDYTGAKVLGFSYASIFLIIVNGAIIAILLLFDQVLSLISSFL